MYSREAARRTVKLHVVTPEIQAAGRLGPEAINARNNCRVLLKAEKVRCGSDRLLRGAVCTAKGPRPNNEDAAVVALTDGGLALAAVADGVGGIERGELASHTAVCNLVSLFVEYVESPYDPNVWLRELFDYIHRSVASGARGGATTLTVGLLAGGELYAANVGDSPLYIDDAYGLRLVTTNLDEEEGYLTQAVGHPTYRQPHIYRTAVRRPALVFAVTDGVDDALKGKYQQALSRREARSAASISKSLVCNALKMGARDNSTAAVIIALG